MIKYEFSRVNLQDILQKRAVKCKNINFIGGLR